MASKELSMKYEDGKAPPSDRMASEALEWVDMLREAPEEVDMLREAPDEGGVLGEAPDEGDSQQIGDRIRKPTEHYVNWQFDQRKHTFKLDCSRWRKKASEMQVVLSDSQNIDIIRKARDGLQTVMHAVSDSLSMLLKLQGVDVEEFVAQHDNIQTENLQIMKNIKGIISDLSVEQRSGCSKKSGMSYLSRMTNKSNASKKAEIAIETAALKTKLRFMDIEGRKRAELKKLKVMRDLEVAEAKMEAVIKVEKEEYDQFPRPDVSQIPVTDKDSFVREFVDSTLEKGPTNHTSREADHSNSENGQAEDQVRPIKNKGARQGKHSEGAPLNVSARPFYPQPNPNPEHDVYNTYERESSTQEQLLTLTKCLSEQLQLGRLPAPEPSVFSGDPLTYPGWKSAFTTLIERRGIPPSERLHYLKRYLDGEAKSAVEGYFLAANDESFIDAKEMLEKRYGDPFLIANAFRTKLERWTKIGPRDTYGLRKLSDFLRQCQSAMDSIGHLSVLDDERENQKLLTKVPEWLVARWNRIVSEWRHTRSSFPPFKEFVSFVNRESDIALDPVTSLQAVKSLDKSDKVDTPRLMRSTAKRTTFATGIHNQKSSAPPSFKTCQLCQNNHKLSECQQFIALKLSDKKEFLLRSGRCFGCLECGHMARDCKLKDQCAKCTRRHPTVLHDDAFEQNRKSSSTRSANSMAGINRMTESTTESKCAMIVPVWVSHVNEPTREVLVYAMLDSQSDTTFATRSVCDALDIRGHPVQLKLSTMTSVDKLVASERIRGLQVRSHERGSSLIALPVTYTRDMIPANTSHIPTPEKALQWSHLAPVADKLLPLQNIDIGLLIGYDCPLALTPREVIPSSHNEDPFAQRTDLGWGIVGPGTAASDLDHDDPIGTSHQMYTDTVKGLPTQKTVCFAVGRTVREAFAPQQVIKMMELDFNEQDKDCLLSQDDKKFIQTMEHGIHRTDNGHYEMPLPLKEEPLNLPNNRSQALNRLSHLKKRFKANPGFYKDYKDFMENLIGQGYAERVDLDKDCGDVWYIPHHGVYHPKKPTKIRVVFDCSSKFQDHCLNDYLLQGPDLTNDMTGVLCRFRKEPIAVVCDIEQMFYQFNVNNEHRDLLRFLWWDDSDFNLNPVEYRMTVHLFGATSSPGCANYGLKRIADDNKGQCGAHAARIVHRNFYVDDGVFSVATASGAITLITDLKEMCRLGGLRLHKFVSSDKSVLQSIPVEDRASELKDLDIMSDSLPLERALGVQWCVESDTFKFQITLKDQPLTRRGILSSVSSIFDPLGFIAPVMLVGKQILQEMVRDQTDWDTPLPDALRTRWEKWRQDLFKLETLSVERCIKPLRSGEHFQVELHHFSDASVQGYGQVSYIKMKDSEGTVHCSFLMGKARVAPIRHVTIPRLELTAAVVSVKVGTFLQRELDYGEVKHVYWTDSQIVLGYINNDTRRFHVYVANRVEQIKSRTSSTQWKYVPSERNPADCASRGMSAKAFIDNSTWISGPEFLWKSDVIELEEDQNILALDPDDPEVKQVKAHVIRVSNAKSILEMERLEIFSDFYRLKRAIANCIRLKRKLKREISSVIPSPLSVDDLQEAEMVIIRTAQHSAFSREIDLLTSMQSGEQGRQRIVRRLTACRRSFA